MISSLACFSFSARAIRRASNCFNVSISNDDDEEEDDVEEEEEDDDEEEVEEEVLDSLVMIVVVTELLTSNKSARLSSFSVPSAESVTEVASEAFPPSADDFGEENEEEVVSGCSEGLLFGSRWEGFGDGEDVGDLDFLVPFSFLPRGVADSAGDSDLSSAEEGRSRWPVDCGLWAAFLSDSEDVSAGESVGELSGFDECSRLVVPPPFLLPLRSLRPPFERRVGRGERRIPGEATDCTEEGVPPDSGEAKASTVSFSVPELSSSISEVIAFRAMLILLWKKSL